MRSFFSDGRYPLNAKFCPFAPEAISASNKLDGPTKGRTSKPCLCANATKFAPGSATAGQPASLTMPILRPSCKGFSNSGKVFKSVCSFSVCRFSSRIGVVTPKCFKCARAVFSASTTKSVSPTIACCSCGNRHGVSGAPKGVGIKYKIGFILATPKNLRPSEHIQTASNYKTSTPSFFKKSIRRKIGRPIKAFGSVLSIRSNKAAPKPSLFAAPAQ